MIPDFRVEGAKHFLQQQAQTTQSALRKLKKFGKN
jgi:hypothetical protein